MPTRSIPLDQLPVGPTRAQLAHLRSQIAAVITDGNGKARKALFEALIEEIKVNSDDSVIPYFRIPTGGNGEGLNLESALDQLDGGSTVRALPTMVGDTGIEPVTSPV